MKRTLSFRGHDEGGRRRVKSARWTARCRREAGRNCLLSAWRNTARQRFKRCCTYPRLKSKAKGRAHFNATGQNGSLTLRSLSRPRWAMISDLCYARGYRVPCRSSGDRTELAWSATSKANTSFLLNLMHPISPLTLLRLLLHHGHGLWKQSFSASPHGGSGTFSCQLGMRRHTTIPSFLCSRSRDLWRYTS